MATVQVAFIARNRKFAVGETVPDGDPLVLAHPGLFGIESKPKPAKSRKATDLKIYEAVAAAGSDD